MRVVSLLPSATETLGAIGGSGLLVGRSHECDFPPEILDRPVLTAAATESASPSAIDEQVGRLLAESQSLYRLDEDLLAQLAPDVILTQDLCSVCSIDLASVRRAAERLDPAPRVVSLNPTTFEGVMDDVVTVGRAVGLEAEAERALVGLRERFFRAADYVTPYVEGPRVAFLEWTDPIYIGGHWTPQLVERSGAKHPLNPTTPLENAGSGAGAQGAHRAAGPSRKVTAEELVASAPEAVIVCPCGVGLEEATRQAEALASAPWWGESPAARTGRVAVVDGNQMFNRPGPRLVDAFEWLVSWINDLPDLAPRGFPWTAPAGART